MELRPNTLELMITCSKTSLCSKCTMRVGCPIRYSFYEGDILVEINLQRAEITLQALVGEEHAYNASCFLRNKMLSERGDHPGGYSYT